MSHLPAEWYETVGDVYNYGANDTRRLQYDFFGVWKKAPSGVGAPAPITAEEAVDAAVTGGATLGIDTIFVPPTSPDITPPNAQQFYVLASMTVERVPNTNTESDVVWMFKCTLENSDPANTTEPYVEVTQSVTLTTVSAFRIYPAIPTEDFSSVAANDQVWHSVQDIGGNYVDWNSQPIQYALPTKQISVSVMRAGLIWDAQGIRDYSTLNAIQLEQASVGKRNTTALGWMGDVGQVLLANIDVKPSGLGLYEVTYQFRWHPWSHAIQVPYMVGGSYDKYQSQYNLLRMHNEKVFWSQPHLEGTDFTADILTTEEWAAIGL